MARRARNPTAPPAMSRDSTRPRIGRVAARMPDERRCCVRVGSRRGALEQAVSPTRTPRTTTTSRRLLTRLTAPTIASSATTEQALHQSRTHYERLGLERGEGNPGNVACGGVGEKPRLPARLELGVEPVQRVDLPPPRRKEQDAAPQPQDRPRSD